MPDPHHRCALFEISMRQSAWGSPSHFSSSVRDYCKCVNIIPAAYFKSLTRLSRCSHRQETLYKSNKHIQKIIKQEASVTMIHNERSKTEIPYFCITLWQCTRFLFFFLFSFGSSPENIFRGRLRWLNQAKDTSEQAAAAAFITDERRHVVHKSSNKLTVRNPEQGCVYG